MTKIGPFAVRLLLIERSRKADIRRALKTGGFRQQTGRSQAHSPPLKAALRSGFAERAQPATFRTAKIGAGWQKCGGRADITLSVCEIG